MTWPVPLLPDHPSDYSKDMAPSGCEGSPLLSLLSGDIAGGIEASITYPLEFGKTRVQLRTEGAKHAQVARKPSHVIHHMIHNEGIRALYKGCTTLIVGSVAKDGIRFLTFDAVKSAFQDPTLGTLTP